MAQHCVINKHDDNNYVLIKDNEFEVINYNFEYSLSLSSSVFLYIYPSFHPSTGHTQMVALVHTQKQQSKLEKLLLQQQRELQKLCKAHEATKAGVCTSYA